MLLLSNTFYSAFKVFYLKLY